MGAVYATLTIYLENSTGNVCECPVSIRKEVDVPNEKLSKLTYKSSSTVKTEQQGIVLTAVPNPFTQSLTVTLKPPSFGKESRSNNHYTLSVINTNGSVLTTKPIHKNTPLRLDTKVFVPGMYLLNVIGSNGTIFKTKVIKIN